MTVFTKRHAPGVRGATPGKLNLRISGFSRQQVVPVERVMRAIDVLPGFHPEGLRETIYARNCSWRCLQVLRTFLVCRHARSA